MERIDWELPPAEGIGADSPFFFCEVKSYPETTGEMMPRTQLEDQQLILRKCDGGPDYHLDVPPKVSS